MRIEPPVSEPSVAGIRRAATDVAPPLVEPPVIRAGSQAFLGCPVCALWPVMPSANSTMLSRPQSMAPAASRRAMTVARRDRPVAAEQGRAVLGQLAGAVEHVLVRERHAVQRPQLVAPALRPRPRPSRRPAPTRDRAGRPRSAPARGCRARRARRAWPRRKKPHPDGSSPRARPRRGRGCRGRARRLLLRGPSGGWWGGSRVRLTTSLSAVEALLLGCGHSGGVSAGGPGMCPNGGGHPCRPVSPGA